MRSLGPDREMLVSRYVLADGGLKVLGRPLVERPPFGLYEVDGPIRVAALASGLFADGWIGQAASVNVYSGDSEGPATVDISVGLAGWNGPDIPANVDITASILETGEDGAPQMGQVVFTESAELHVGDVRSYTIDARPGPLRVEILVDRTLSPADFGLGDSRQLGVQFVYAIR